MKPKIGNYIKKRDYYLNAYQAASSTLHLDHLRDAVFWTDVCLDLFLDFMSSLKASLDRVKQFEIESAQRLRASAENIATMERLTQNALNETAVRGPQWQQLIKDAEDDPKLQSLITKFESDMQTRITERNQLFNDVLQAAIEFETSLSQVRDMTVSLDRATHAAALENITKALFDVIYGANNRKRIVSAVVTLFDFAIGLTPLGTLMAALQTAQSLFEARANEIQSADDYLQALELYLLSTQAWCLLTVVLVDILDNFQVRHRPLSLDEAHVQLNVRTDRLSAGWNIDAPINLSERNQLNKGGSDASTDHLV